MNGAVLLILPLFLAVVFAEDETCNVLRIITGQVTENQFCNLKDLLREQMADEKDVITLDLPVRPKKYSVELIREELAGKAATIYCDPSNTICRAEGQRICVCPPTFICGSEFGTSFQRCSKLSFLGA
ncbi:unnamed protein product, partial [Mesorhabditis spiculigera]